MRKIVTTALLALVGLVAVGLLSLQSATAGQADDRPNDQVSKRDDDTPDLVLVADDDDDDTNDDTHSRSTGASRATRDHTSSRFTAVSRDRDLSRGDKTRDRTHDGSGQVKRDWSANHTNDRSRNDTRR